MTDAASAPTTESPDAPSTRYVPEAVETKWIAEWDARGTFHAEVDESLEPYTIVVPPPNVKVRLWRCSVRRSGLHEGACQAEPERALGPIRKRLCSV